MSILEAPTALLIKDNEFEEPLYLREGIEIVFTQDYIRLLPEIGLEAEFIVKNELETPKEKPVWYIMRSGKLSKVYSKEHINLANSIEIYSCQKIPSFLWKREQVK
ncbi:hypothetical protein [Paenibacillus sp. 276b]|uniref:hypothetical protein n=1 Tax=Paenibacillus sp. 276b TaxID=1566277 RepID=UPI00089528A8|nr:hypothetical protein [Paenibacillus sp. 276b]SEB27494.1 hypothetical protein SAMN03159332_6155 [Paenibacillus sp. 276b]